MADVSFFSPYAVGGATRPDSFTNLNPLMRSRLMEMLMAAKEELGPDALRITSAYRSPELQGQLYQEALKKYGTPEETRRWVAPAGRSQHNFGTAVDFANLQGQLLRDPNSPEAKWLKANAAKFGLAVPLSNEPWQVELEGARSGNISQGQQMRLSTKDAQMTPMDQKKPETLWGRLTNTSERSGLNPLEAFASALDPLIMPELRAGGAIREMGAQRAALAKEDKTKNATLNELRKRAAAGDTIAQRYYEAISTGALDTKTGFSGYLNEVASMSQLDKQLAATASKTESFKTLTGAEINKIRGTNLPADKLYNLSSTGKITQVGGGDTIIGGTEKAWEKGIGELGVKRLEEIQNAASAAVDILGQNQILTSLMNDPEFQSGALAEPKMAYKKIIEALGGDPANVASQEAFQSVTSQLILSKMGGSLGAGFSEGDRKFVESMAPSLSTSKLGNKLIIEMNNAVAKRQIQINEFANKYIEDYGMLDEKFNAALSKWANENPAFADIKPPTSYF